MLSYRHGFHAGNHADTLKHIVLCLIMRSLHRKDKPAMYIDTHAGAGAYSLKSAWSNKTSEYTNGIAKIINNEELQKLVPEYYEVIDDINDHSKSLENYPGSPYIASFLAREQDDLNLIELHPTEYENLKYNMHYNTNVHVHNRDAYEGLKALLPPKIRRGLILIDPSYEMAEDYRNIVKLIKESYSKFAQGIYALWYPVLGARSDESYQLIRSIQKLNIPNTIHAQLCISEANSERGMHGSGMIICNAPFNLFEDLQPIMPILEQSLKLDKAAKTKLEILVPGN